MHGYGYLQPDSAAYHARNRHQIISYDAISDARRPGARADLLRLRYSPPGTLRRRAQRPEQAAEERSRSVRMPRLRGRGCGSAGVLLGQDRVLLSEG